MQKPLTSVILILIVMSSIQSMAQQSKHDLALIATHRPASSLPDHSYDQSKKKTTLIQAINPIYWVYKGGISFYQNHISEQLSTSCIYETSCSRFSKELFHEYGAVKAFFLSADRISRCNRITYSETFKLSLNSEGRIKEEATDYSFKR